MILATTSQGTVVGVIPATITGGTPRRRVILVSMVETPSELIFSCGLNASSQLTGRSISDGDNDSSSDEEIARTPAPCTSSRTREPSLPCPNSTTDEFFFTFITLGQLTGSAVIILTRQVITSPFSYFRRSSPVDVWKTPTPKSLPERDNEPSRSKIDSVASSECGQ